MVTISKRIIKSAWAAGVRLTRMLESAERCMRGRLVILCYHRILPESDKRNYPLPDLVVTPESFRQQCEVLARRYEVRLLTECLERLRASHSGRRPLAAITFDDGYEDNYEYAAPILSRVGLPATFFVLSELVETGKAAWYDRLGRSAVQLLQANHREIVTRICSRFGIQCPSDISAQVRTLIAAAKLLPPEHRCELVDRCVNEAELHDSAMTRDRLMTWEQLGRMVQHGHDVGSHSATHEILTQLDDASLRREVSDSKELLESRLARPVHSFCYPNGDVDDRVANAVRGAGYRCAVTVEQGDNDGRDDPFRLRRCFIHEDRMFGIRRRISPILLRIELCRLRDRMFRTSIRHMNPA